MERIALGVRPPQRRLPVGVLGADHVVVDEQVVEPHLLDADADVVHRLRIAAQLDLRVDDAQLHPFALLGFGAPPSRRGSIPASSTRRSLIRHRSSSLTH